MSTLENVKIKPTKLVIEGQTYYIKYDFNAFIELESIYGDIDSAMKEMQGEVVIGKDGKPEMIEELDEKGNIVKDAEGKPNMVKKRKILFKVIRDFLWAGLLWNKPETTKKQAGELLEFSIFKEVMTKVGEALTAAMPKTVGEEVKN